MTETGIVKDYQVDQTTYRYRGYVDSYSGDDDYSVHIVKGQCEIDITDAAQHLFIDHPSPFNGKLWLVDCILEFGDDVPIGGKI